jgi:hypothetical protein
MPEEIEVPTEHLHEQMHEHAHEATHDRVWVARVAVSSALLAVVAAISSLLAGHHANEAMLEQMKATDQWAYYQAKGIKSSVMQSKAEMMQALGHPVSSAETAKIATYEADQRKIEETGHELEHSSEEHMARHSVLARAVTILQIAIAMGAIAVLARRRPLWVVSLVFGATGLVFLIQGVI